MLVRPLDLVVLGCNLGVMVAIGAYCARKSRSADDYFLADRSMPGWVVAVSMMATIISSMTFLAMPGATYKDDWRFMPAHFLYFIPAIVGYLVFMPFFRRGHVRSAYEYLELRFGTWARMYGAVAFLLHHMFRTGIILYVVSLPFQRMLGLDSPTSVIIVIGVLVGVYTIAGGLKAVIYTDFLQGIILILGGLMCLPILSQAFEGGLGQIFSEAYRLGKFSGGNFQFRFDEKTIWVIILVYQFQFLQLVCTDQNMVQRYLAMKTDKQARNGFILGTLLTIPVWMYFAFIGTALFVFYSHYPTTALDGAKPEEVFPYFILTEVPAGVAGLVISGVLAAAMSTLDSSVNASAATVTNDFYRRFQAQHKSDEKSEEHYLLVGRIFSVVFSLIMIGVALLIDAMRTTTLMDVQTVVYPIVSAGLLSLFLLGFFSVRVGSQAALVATVLTIALVACWVTGSTMPALAKNLPDKYWVGVVPHVFLIVVGLLLSFALPRKETASLNNLTIWTTKES